MGARGRPDARLRSLLAEAGWSGQQLAAAVNALGAEAGLRLRYDRTSVAHWLAGSTPNTPVPELIAEAFTRWLGRDIRVGAERFVPQPEHEDSRTGSGPGRFEAVDAVARLVQLHTERRRLLREGVYSIAALTVSDWRHAAAPQPSPAGESGRIRRGAPEAAQAMARVFSDADAAFGGRRQAVALASYLALDITPKLQARAAPAVRQAMFAAASELTYLCAFMHFDAGQHALAQRYYTAALALAAENHDPARYATTLRALSVQADSLGHHEQALHLADAAISAAPGSMAPRTRAFLYGQGAVAAAGTGDAHTALAHLRRAETLLERGPAPDATIGAYHQASLAHQKAAVLTALSDIPGAIRALSTSIRHRPEAERRARTLTLAALAQLHLRQGELEQATATWGLFVADYPHLDSARADTALAEMRAGLRPHRRNRNVAHLWEQAARITAPLKG